MSSVSEWLKSLSLSEYEEVLQQKGYTALHQLSGITQEQLKEIGVVKIGHIKRMLKNVPQITNGDENEASQPNTASGELVSSGEEQPRPTPTHVAAEEEGEAPAPALPPRRRRSSSGFSDSDSHSDVLPVSSPERNLSPPPMNPLHEDHLSEKPPAVPRRQQSLRNMRRGSREAEDVQARPRRSSKDRQSQRMSLPPDSITFIPGLTNTKIRPPIPMRKSSLTPSPDLAVIPPSPPTPQRSQVSILQPVSSPEHSPAESEQSDQDDELSTTAEEPHVDQRLLVGGPPSFTPSPPPLTQEGGKDTEVEMKPATSNASYVNIEMIPQAPTSSSPTPLPRKISSPKQPIAAPRRRKTAASSAQRSDPQPTDSGTVLPADPTSDTKEDLVHEPKPTETSPPQYSVVQKKQLQRAGAMPEYLYVAGATQPVLAPEPQQSEGASLGDYQEVGPARPIYEEISATPPQSDVNPPQPDTAPPQSDTTPPQSGATPLQQSEGASLGDYQEVGPSRPIYEEIDSALPQSGVHLPQSNAPLPQPDPTPLQPDAMRPQTGATPPESQDTPPLPLGITSAYNMVEVVGNSSHPSTPSSGGTTPEILPEGARPLPSSHSPLGYSSSSPDILSPNTSSSSVGDIPLPPRVNRRTPGGGATNAYVELPNLSPKGRSVSVMVKSQSEKELSTSPPQARSLNRGQHLLSIDSQLSVPASPLGRRRLGTMTETGESLMQITPAWARLNDSLTQAPRTKEGWMDKRGGKKGEKPWTTRWFVFDGRSLKYFRSQNDKESECLKDVPLSEMIDVKQVVDPESKKTHRLDLITSNRVFQFSAPSAEVCMSWITVLQGAMATYKPTETHEGGPFHNPDLCGHLNKQGHGAIKRWEKRYVALKGSKLAYYHSKEDYTVNKPIHVLEMKLVNARPDTSGNYRFILTTNKKSYIFQAVSDIERNEWLDAIRMAILKGLDDEKHVERGNVPTSQDILDRICRNEANRTCADCSGANPVWASVNLAIMLCINCSGVHRSMGTHISKVRSVELDKSIWTDTLVNLMVSVGNATANHFWEHHLQQEKLDAEVERDIREAFIRAKYETKAWVPRSGGSSETLSKALCVSAATDNVHRSYELICGGANVRYEHPSPKEPEQNTPHLIAEAHGQDLQLELLKQNGAQVGGGAEREELNLRICKRGYLWKTGGDRTGWKKRFSTLDSDSFKYFKDDSCSEEQGCLSVGDMLSVSKMDDDSVSLGTARYFQFEVTTVSRVYLLGCDSEQERASWLVDFQRVIPPDAGERLGFDRIGYLQLNYKLPPVWRQHWFTLKSKQLTFYKRNEEKEVLDLRKLTSLKGPECGSEEQNAVQMVFSSRTYILKGANCTETDLWYNAIRHTQVSGIPLQNQVTTSGGVPVIVHKCVQFVEGYGMDVEGVYRHSGQRAKIQRLTLEFNQDAKGVVIDQEAYNVHDVTGAMKQFFRNLPDPLLTHQLYEEFIGAAQLLDHENQLYQLQSLIDQLPAVNRVTLKSVLGHLHRVISHESRNKMGLNNIVRIFGPTLMTVDGDTISFHNSVHEFKVISIMITYYQWLFQVDEEELHREQAMQDAMKRLEAAKQLQMSMSQSLGNVQHSTTATFIVTVYLLHRDGDSCNIKAGQLSSVEEVTEQVAVAKTLEPDNYALYLVLGDAVSERFLHPTERILQVIQDCCMDHYLCIKPNTLNSVLRDHLKPNRVPVNLWVKEKKKWSKKPQPAAVLSKMFTLYKAAKAYQEVFKNSVDAFDLYIGFASDIKCPAPTRYQFWLKGRTEEQTKYLCADTDQDMFIIIGAILHAKFPDGISTRIVPREQPGVQSPAPMMTQQSSPSLLPQHATADSTYLNVTIRTRPTPKVPSVTSLS